jgi:phosphate-selective porin OprO/OprP
MKRKVLSLMIAGLAATQTQAGTVTSSGDDVIIKTNGGFSLQTADKSKSFGVGGRIQWDYNYAEIDPENGAERNEENQFDVRRARVYLKGHVGDWAYKAQWNLDDEDGEAGGSIEDLYLRYTGFGKQANVTIGRTNAPFGLELLTSSKDISMLERTAATELFVPGRQDGVQVHGKGNNWTYGLGVYEAGDDSNLKDNGDINTAGDETSARNLAVVGRFTYAPINEKGNVLHLGAGFQSAGGSDRLNNSRGVKNFVMEDAYNLEIAGVIDAFHYQAEFFDGTLGLDDGGNDVDAYYVQFGYILTGESRPYKDGKFKIVTPSDKTGAWELVARYEDGDGNFGDYELPSLVNAESIGVGINYYANNNIRIGANYTVAESNESGDEGNEFRVRFQYVYK